MWRKIESTFINYQNFFTNVFIKALVEALHELDNAGQKIGSIIDQEKTNYVCK